MKKYILLTIFLLASFKGISQIDTVAVKLNDPVARLVIKDLITGDACAQELKQTQVTLRLTENKVVKQQQLIANLEKDVSKTDQIVLMKDQQLESKDKIIKDQEKQFKRLGVRSVLTIIAAAASGFLIGGLFIN